jgi:thiamine biosynthesis lipoprotein
VDIRHPLKDATITRCCLSNQALAISGNREQQTEITGHRVGHLLDPRTGYPAEGIILAVAIAPTAEKADALSTAFFVAGSTLAKQVCDADSALGALLITYNPSTENLNLLGYGALKGLWEEEN